MATVPIRDILDNETGEPVFPRTHVKAVIGLADSNFFEEYVDGNGIRSVKLRSDYAGLWTEGWMANGGIGNGGGGGGGGLINGVYRASDLGTIYSQGGTDDITKTFSAFAVDKIWQTVQGMSLSIGAQSATLTVNGTTGQFYTAAQVDNLLVGVRSFEPIPVDALPTASADTMYKLYLVPSTNPQAGNVKDEYITIRSGSVGNYSYSWELIGSTAIDLSGYVTTTALSTWAGSQNITTLGTISSGSIPLSLVSGASDLKAIEDLSGTSGFLKKTAANTWALDTTAYLPLTGGTMTGSILMNNCDIVPVSGATSNLGSSSARFSYVYSSIGDFSGNIYVGGTVNVNSLNSIDQSNNDMAMFNYGARMTKTFDAYGIGANLRVIDSNGTQTNIFAVNGNVALVGSTLRPNYGVATADLGSGSNDGGRWATIYGVNGNLSGDLTMSVTSHIDIGPLRLEYDSTNYALRVTKKDGTDATAYGFYADGFVAAGGIGDGQGGGGVIPIASDTTLGGVRIGSGLTIDSTTGVLSVDDIGLRQLSDVYHNQNTVLRSNGSAVLAGDSLVYDSELGWIAAPISVSGVVKKIACGGYNNLTPDANGLVSITTAVVDQIQYWCQEHVTVYRDYNPPSGEGTKIATITVGNYTYTIKAPTSGGSSGATTLGGLNDVTISNLSAGQALVYRNGAWRNESINPGAGLYLGDLENVSISGPVAGQALVYRNGYWVNETIQGGGGVTSLYQLDEVLASTSPSANQIFYYNGTKWTAISLKTINNLPLLGSGNIDVSGGGGSGSSVGWGTSGNDFVYLSVDGDSRKLLTEHQSLSGYVTLSTTQEITGAKTFTTNPVNIGQTSGLSIHPSSYIDLGPIRIKFENNALHITKANPNDQNEYGIYADGFVSAGGVGQSS